MELKKHYFIDCRYYKWINKLVDKELVTCKDCLDKLWLYKIKYSKPTIEAIKCRQDYYNRTEQSYYNRKKIKEARKKYYI